MSELIPGSKQFKVFEESGGCHDFFDLHEERGGTYKSKFLKLLIRAKDYEFGFTKTSYAKIEVAKIESEIPEGCDRETVVEYRVEWLGYEERSVEKAENLDHCEAVIKEFWKYKNLERRLNEPKVTKRKTGKRKSKRKSAGKPAEISEVPIPKVTERVMRIRKE